MFVCFKQTGVGLRSSGKTGIVLLVNDRWPDGLDNACNNNIVMSPSKAYWGTVESCSRFAVQCHATSFFLAVRRSFAER